MLFPRLLVKQFFFFFFSDSSDVDKEKTCVCGDF